MANDVFLSYARTDIARARQIKDLLEGLGLTVFFDTEGLDGGDVFPDVLDHEVKAAGAVVGVWSTHALTRPWVKIECDIGKTRGVLVPLQIETIADLDRPAAFWNIQFADLSDFDGDADHAGWLRFLRSLARTLDRPDLLERESAAQAATPDSQDAPAPRSKTPLIAGGILIAALIAGVVGWQIFKPVPQTTSVPATASALTESDGVAYHVEACENGLTAGCMSAATAYAYGEGVEVDRSLSLGYYDRGCDLGDMEACWVGGIVYEQDGELRVARALYDRACLGGAQDGCGLLSDLNLTGGIEKWSETVSEVALEPWNRISARDWSLKTANDLLIRVLKDTNVTALEIAAIEGNANAAAFTGYAYHRAQDGVSQDNGKAFSLYNQACKGGNALGCLQLAGMYRVSDDGVEPDPAKEIRYYRQACDGNNMRGCHQLANIYRSDETTSVNMTVAKRLYHKACNAGYDFSCASLRAFFPN